MYMSDRYNICSQYIYLKYIYLYTVYKLKASGFLSAIPHTYFTSFLVILWANISLSFNNKIFRATAQSLRCWLNGVWLKTPATQVNTQKHTYTHTLCMHIFISFQNTVEAFSNLRIRTYFSTYEIFNGRFSCQ